MVKIVFHWRGICQMDWCTIWPFSRKYQITRVSINCAGCFFGVFLCLPPLCRGCTHNRLSALHPAHADGKGPAKRIVWGEKHLRSPRNRHSSCKMWKLKMVVAFGKVNWSMDACLAQTMQFMSSVSKPKSALCHGQSTVVYLFACNVRLIDKIQRTNLYAIPLPVFCCFLKWFTESCRACVHSNWQNKTCWVAQEGKFFPKMAGNN